VIELSVAEVVDAIQASPKGDGASDIRTPFPSVSIDSRTIRAGECFIAVTGQQFDGHDFVEEALKKGASTVIFSKNSVDFSHWRDRMFLQVEDPEVALQALARHVRKRWGKPLLAISGSTGKTTTREFIATLLSQKFKVVQSPGNLNNQIGVPLSLLQLMEEHQVALLELGMNHAGEIRALTKICNPDSALLTNVAAVHLEFFSDLDAIAAAKGEILEGLPQEGKFFFNADDSRLTRLASHFSGEKVSFALENEAGVRVFDYRLEGLREMSFTIDAGGERFTATVPFVGKHFLYNIAAAVAVAVSFGLTREEICKGIPKLEVPSMRGQVHEVRGEEGDPITLWDDSYNSNPQALHMVLETVGQLGGFARKIVALGQMLELGSSSPELHRQAGQQVARCKADLLVTVGKDGVYIGQGAKEEGFPPEKITHFEDSREAAEFLVKELGPGEFLLVKGSRGTRMDRIVREIEGGRGH
jgi:UDP-N-acetylmuramoyl-tripeptide--D-alanyl-D-alanine ligase